MGQIIGIQGKQLLMDLIVFKMSDSKMILIMEFLRRNEAKINHQYKKVWFNLENGDQFKFNKGYVKSILINTGKENVE